MSLEFLDYEAMTYDWGKSASTSEVASLLGINGKKIDDTLPYAELWLGSHPNAPTKYKNGTHIPKLPFLFKILSINKPLSIQSHPDKLLAKELNNKFPKIYPDDNHKPKMAIAITDFEAFYGFITHESYLKLKHTYFNKIFDNCHDVESAFIKLIKMTPLEIKDSINLLQHVVPPNHIFWTMFDNYKYDCGVICSLLLQYCKLKPLEAMYINPNVPYSYISGTIAECMASSDNVIRVGCTTKFIDKETLCSSLRFNSTELHKIASKKSFAYINTYIPPTSEFKVGHVNLLSNETFNFTSKDDGLLLAYSGDGVINNNKVRKGDAIYIKASVNYLISTSSNLVLFIVSSNMTIHNIIVNNNIMYI
jgi:mannose-6-phosphate isomerase